MQDLTFGEQVKIILGRRGMTIKELAEMIEEKTGKKMSRQNLTQRLGRDNFQEQDMRMIAEILDCPFELNIMGDESAESAAEPAAAEKSRGIKTPTAKREASTVTASPEAEPAAAAAQQQAAATEPETAAEEPETEAAEPETRKEEFDFLEKEREVTVGEVLDAEARAQGMPAEQETASADTDRTEADRTEAARKKAPQSDTAWAEAVQAEMARKNNPQKEQTPEGGEINPYTGKEYESNSVRMHPKRIGYVQVYDQSQHQWVDMTEWAFLGYEERKKELMGDRYEPPIYLD